MGGQVKQCLSMKARCFSNTGGADRVERMVLNADFTASTLQTAVYKSSLGNLAFKVDFGNTPDFDGLTSGLIEIDIEYIAK